jgi:hypothetical protein
MRFSKIILFPIFSVWAIAHPIVDTSGSLPIRSVNYPTATKIVNRQSIKPVSTAVGTQSCHATDHGAFASYSVLIGIPYQGSQACDNTYSNLEFNFVGVSSWQCGENNGNIQLFFDAQTNLGSNINSGLDACYPNIVEGFNCPNY